ncbi:Late embryogenesis abundant protein [Sesbania bispinosa]|nr:Late embryogenesis abundant protein [Sesbania bispinosa]KAJ1379929.1 Late embryogenesis abundant protein [Sesbania bispinosa]
MAVHQKLGFMKRFVCPLALLLLLAAEIIGVVILTMFHVKDPIMQINNVKVTEFNPIGNTTLITDVSMKNPNFASFEYNNTTTTLYYRGIMVGEARGPPGKAKAKAHNKDEYDHECDYSAHCF